MNRLSVFLPIFTSLFFFLRLSGRFNCFRLSLLLSTCFTNHLCLRLFKSRSSCSSISSYLFFLCFSRLTAFHFPISLSLCLFVSRSLHHSGSPPFSFSISANLYQSDLAFLPSFVSFYLYPSILPSLFLPAHCTFIHLCLHRSFPMSSFSFYNFSLYLSPSVSPYLHTPVFMSNF